MVRVRAEALGLGRPYQRYGTICTIGRDNYRTGTFAAARRVRVRVRVRVGVRVGVRVWVGIRVRGV